MHVKFIALLAVVAATPALAQGYNFKPDEYQYLSAEALDKTLVMHPGDHPYAGNTVNRHEFYWVEFMKRFDHGNVIENHEHWVDYITVLGGEGRVEYGGTVDGAQPAGTGELRGGTMTGGTIQALKTGDYLQIPAGVPHLINAAPGKELKYVIFKHRI